MLTMDVDAEMPQDENPWSTPEAGDLGPIHPTTEVRTEVAAILEADESRLGDVYRGLQRELSADAIAEYLGVFTSNFVWNYQQTIKALLDGDLPAKPTVALAVARRFRTMLKSPHLSPVLRAYLNTNLEELERRANNEMARVAEAKQAQEHTEQAEALNEIGIYVYALPHYLRYPFESESGRTLMKVGRSGSDVMVRFRNQTRTTALPEEPILLRIYRTNGTIDVISVERDFHQLLEAAGHYRSVARSAGREWFATSTRFLDEVARVLHLDIKIVSDEVEFLE